jgi:hypothetical protein
LLLVVFSLGMSPILYSYSQPDANNALDMTQVPSVVSSP